MSRGKHAPARLSTYTSKHNNYLQGYVDRDFVIAVHGLEFENVDGCILLVGVIECLGGLYIDVTKRIIILDDDPADPYVQTESYRYNVALRGRGTVFRYDSPHPTHNQEHHVHRYDVWTRESIEDPQFIYTENARPTLGDVIGETEAWYYANIDRLRNTP